MTSLSSRVKSISIHCLSVSLFSCLMVLVSKAKSFRLVCFEFLKSHFLLLFYALIVNPCLYFFLRSALPLCDHRNRSNRVRYYGYKISRYPANIARYKMLKHKGDTPNPDRYVLTGPTGHRTAQSLAFSPYRFSPDFMFQMFYAIRNRLQTKTFLTFKSFFISIFKDFFQH